MIRGTKNFPAVFAGLSLGFVLLLGPASPVAVSASTTRSTVKQEAANSQFARAEDLRTALNGKPAEQRTLNDYKHVVAAYQRVYLITPRATVVPESLVAVAELNTEMGDRFGRSFYQAAADSYSFLIREYPASKFVPEAMLCLARLQKDQLGDAAAATKTLQDFERKFPHSPHKREAQESLAELALLKNAETGTSSTKTTATLPSPTPVAPEAPLAPGRRTASGGQASPSGTVPHVQKIHTSVTADSTEVVIELEDSVQYSSGHIANPERIYFDLHAARLSPAVARGTVHVSGDLLTKVRVAQNQAGVVRVVLDVNGVSDYAVSLTKKPCRLLIELYPSANRGKSTTTASSSTAEKIPLQPKPSGTDLAAPAQAYLPSEPAVPAATVPAQAAALPAPAGATSAPGPEGTAPAPSSSSLTHATSSKSKSKPELVQPTTTPQPTHDGQSTLTRALGLKIERIVIDAGHGGHDTGTIGPTGLMEKDLCLDVALRLGKLIQQKLPGAEIVYTRSDDTFVPLEERTHIANEAKADLFVSIHANSSPDRGARGVETYYLNLKGSPEAMEVAARENAVSQESIHDLEDVVKKIARTEKIEESRELAEDIQDNLAKRIQHTAKPVRNRGVRKAPFVVLIGADMPSILTEISFLSNPSDEQLLKKPEHRQRIAEGVYQGVAVYLQSMNSVTVNSAARPNRPAVVPAVEQSRNQK